MIEVHPATPGRWDDVARVLGRRDQDPSTCWCQRFLGGAGAGGTTGGSQDHRTALRHEVETASRPPGLVAYVDGSPAGWTRTGPRDGFPGVRGNRALARLLPVEDGVWWVTCFAVRAEHRGAGVSAALLEAAVDLAGRHGARAVEGHPVDVAALRATAVSGSALFTGTMTTFERAGFREVGRTYRSRPVMRREL